MKTVKDLYILGMFTLLFASHSGKAQTQTAEQTRYAQEISAQIAKSIEDARCVGRYYMKNWLPRTSPMFIAPFNAQTLNECIHEVLANSMEASFDGKKNAHLTVIEFRTGSKSEYFHFEPKGSR